MILINFRLKKVEYLDGAGDMTKESSTLKFSEVPIAETSTSAEHEWFHDAYRQIFNRFVYYSFRKLLGPGSYFCS